MNRNLIETAFETLWAVLPFVLGLIVLIAVTAFIAIQLTAIVYKNKMKQLEESKIKEQQPEEETVDFPEIQNVSKVSNESNISYETYLADETERWR